MKSLNNLIAIAGFICLYMAASTINANAQTVKDINGHTYNTIKIGKVEWTASNLNVDRFQNGDPIPQAKTDVEWEMAGKNGKPAWCYYNNDTANGRKYGKLYNFYAINDPRGLAPKSWKIPGNYEWSAMIKLLGGIDYAGIKLKSMVGWKQNIKGSNKIGFTALPGGFRDVKGVFRNIENNGQWWSTSEDVSGSNDKWTVALNSNSVEAGYFKSAREAGLSVRCVK